jgi:hypothetical protein
LEQAAKGGQEHVEAQPTRRFVGSGYRLGSDVNDSTRIAATETSQEPESVKFN